MIGKNSAMSSMGLARVKLKPAEQNIYAPPNSIGLKKDY